MTIPRLLKKSSKTRRMAIMIKKSFELSKVKETKGKIVVNFNELTEVSNYVKTESTNLLTSLLETKLIGKENIESQTGGANE